MLPVVRTIALFIGIVAAVCASQAPEYAQQYRQRLGGAIDELKRFLADFDADAAREGITREQGVARLRANDDLFVRERGDQTAEISAREARLETQLNDFARAGPFRRLEMFVRDYDPAIARRAYESFEPAVPVTSEGFVGGFIGFVFGVGLTRVLAWPLTRRYARRPGEPARARA